MGFETPRQEMLIGQKELHDLLQSIHPTRVALIWQNFLKNRARSKNQVVVPFSEYRKELLAELRAQENKETSIPVPLLDNVPIRDVSEIQGFILGRLRLSDSRHAEVLPGLETLDWAQ